MVHRQAQFTSIALLVLAVLLTAQPAHAARWPIGTNWKTARVDGIRVHVPARYERYGNYTLFAAQRQLQLLNRRYEQRPDRVHILLNPYARNSSSMAIVVPTRVELALHPALDKGLRPQAAFYIERALIHELAHTSQFSTTAGITTPLRAVFGEAVVPVGIQPDWIAEGYSILAESWGGGGRMNSAYHAMYWRTALLEGRQWSLGQASTYGGVRPPSNRAYVTGAMLFERFWGKGVGQPVLADWLEEQAAWPALHAIAFRRAFHSGSPGRMYERIISEYRSDYRSFMLARDRKGLAVGERVRAEKRTSYRDPQWTPEGDLMVWSDSYDHVSRLETVQFRGMGSSLQKGPRLGYNSHKGLTPFGDGVIVAERRRGPWSGERTSSVLVYRDMGGSVKDFGDLKGWAPAGSQPAGRLAYVVINEKGEAALLTVPLDENAQPTAPPDTLWRSAWGHINDPAWSGDGKTLAFASDQGEGERVHLLGPDTGRHRVVHIMGASNTWDPAFSPDGTLWVSADPGNVFDLFQVNLEDERAWRRTRVLSGAFEPAVAPDGETVAYVHYTHQGHSLALLRPERQANEPAEITINPAEAPQAPEGAEADSYNWKPYRSWKYSAPRFWLPYVAGVDEYAGGAFVYGRDPLGLLEWRLVGLAGFETGEPDVEASLSSRALPVNLSLFAHSYPAETVQYYIDEQSERGYRGEVVFERRYEGGVTLSQTLYRDRGAWNGRFYPYTGWVTRHRNLQRSLPGTPDTFRYHGIRSGLTALWWQMAARDPVPRRLFRAGVRTEYHLPEFSDLTGDILEWELQGNLPMPVRHWVGSVGITGQQQQGSLGFSRVNVTPRGFEDTKVRDEVSPERAVKGSAELHFPIAWPDWAIGLGWLHIPQIDGTLFYDGVAGMEKDFTDLGGRHLQSAGAELHISTRWLYNADIRLTVGGAWLLSDGEPSFLFGFSLPGNLGLLRRGETGPGSTVPARPWDLR
jgi:hypothetical protein